MNIMICRINNVCLLRPLYLISIWLHMYIQHPCGAISIDTMTIIRDTIASCQDYWSQFNNFFFFKICKLVSGDRSLFRSWKSSEHQVSCPTHGFYRHSTCGASGEEYCSEQSLSKGDKNRSIICFCDDNFMKAITNTMCSISCHKYTTPNAKHQASHPNKYTNKKKKE